MAFYVSDALKGLITEESLLQDGREDEKQINFLSSIYAEIQTDKKILYFDIIMIDETNQKSIVCFASPQDLDLSSYSLEKILDTKLWSKFKIKINHKNFDDSDNPVIYSIDCNKIILTKFEKSLTGYNYTFTILIDDKLMS